MRTHLSLTNCVHGIYNNNGYFLYCVYPKEPGLDVTIDTSNFTNTEAFSTGRVEGLIKFSECGINTGDSDSCTLFDSGASNINTIEMYLNNKIQNNGKMINVTLGGVLIDELTMTQQEGNLIVIWQ